PLGPRAEETARGAPGQAGPGRRGSGAHPPDRTQQGQEAGHELPRRGLQECLAGSAVRVHLRQAPQVAERKAAARSAREVEGEARCLAAPAASGYAATLVLFHAPVTSTGSPF